MCIYYINSKGLHYTQEEHVFPAALGGRAVLARGTVSDEFNNEISALEQRFIRNSLVSFPRQLYGPGKRGRTGESSATKSKVSVFKDGKGRYSLGYVKTGRPYQITTLEFNTETRNVSFTLDQRTDHRQLLDDFKRACLKAETLSIRSWDDHNLPEHTVLFGIAAGIEEKRNAFIVKHPASKVLLDTQTIREIGRKLTFAASTAESVREHPQIHQSVDFHEDYFRLYAKIAFNFLAYRMGKDFVFHPCFDPLRHWIATGGANAFARLNTEPQKGSLPVPRNAHSVVIGKAENALIGHVALYERLDVHVVLAKEFTGDFSLCGMICDWEQKAETELFAYLQTLVNKDAKPN